MSDSMPFFTIAIPVFNRFGYFKDALTSVLNQIFTDFEIVIVDDCSTDGTWEYIQTLQDPRIRIYRNEKNLGIVPNWRRCIELAKGKWFKFLMSDDLMFPAALDVLKVLIDKYPDNFVIVTSGIGFRDFKTIENYFQYSSLDIGDTEKYLKSMSSVINERKHFNLTWAMPNSFTLPTDDLQQLVKTKNYHDIEKKLGKTGHCVDYFILYSVATKYKTMIEMDVPLYAVRYHESNLSKGYSQDLLYHLNGDKYVSYMLHDFKGIENLYIIRHAFRVYFHKFRTNKRELFSFSLIKKTLQLFTFIFQHLFNINKDFKG
jgi:glycosyltransferase involved in cell wall biosynthesis